MIIIKHKYTTIHGCVGKKTALLQAEASCKPLSIFSFRVNVFLLSC